MDVHEGLVTQNIADIAANKSQIASNQSQIASLGADVYSLRSGIAATLATAGMPMAPGKGWGMSVGVGSYESESAIAAGLTFAGEKVNFKFAAGNSGGETTLSAGAAWNF